MLSADDAIDRLREGNTRYVSGQTGREAPTSDRRSELVGGQEPFAIILGCSDSRVPAELIFDQGLGDLFVIRVAGNIVAPSQIGSVEFAAAQFGTRLVVVLGHGGCGAVTATLEELEDPSDTRHPNLGSIIDRIAPAVETLLEVPELRADRTALIDRAVRANIRASVSQLRHGSKILEDLIAHDGLKVVGAEYDMESGWVEFY